MMKVVLCALLVLSTTALNLNAPQWSLKEQKILAQVTSTNWGSFILNFAEVHLQTGGYLQELLTAIEELVEQLDTELAEVHHQFSRRTDVHNRETTRLEQEIQDKERELFNAHDFYDNVLIPQKERFANQLEQLQANIAQNRKSLNEETFQRNKDHEDFEARAEEHTEAINAIDESLVLLSQLGTPSLVQIKKVQKNLTRIQTSLKRHSTFQTFIKALLEIASESNFADQGALKQIITAFNELRVQLVDSLNQETADEADDAAAFIVRVDQLNAEHNDFQRSVVIKNAEIDANLAKIDATIELIGDLDADLATLNGQLNAENDDYAAATDVYNSLVTEYNKELNAAHQALDLVSQPKVQDYIKSKGGA